MKDKLDREILRGDTVALVIPLYGERAMTIKLTLAKVIDVAAFAIKLKELVDGKPDAYFDDVITNTSRVVIVQRQSPAAIP